MGKAILTAFVVLIVGLVFMAVGNDFLNGFTELGTVVSVAVAGAMVVFFNEKKK